MKCDICGRKQFEPSDDGGLCNDCWPTFHQQPTHLIANMPYMANPFRLAIYRAGYGIRRTHYTANCGKCNWTTTIQFHEDKTQEDHDAIPTAYADHALLTKIQGHLDANPDCTIGDMQIESPCTLGR